ncbi:MAG: response regulator [Candidatus Cyclobacteriaceae bacterium M3_2C_046]
MLKKVVLVDDDEINLELCKLVISDMSVAEDIITFSDPEEGLLYCKQLNNSKASNLIFLDIHMPGIDGFEFLQHLKDNNQVENLNVVILSSSNHPNDLSLAKKHAIKGYIKKPLTKLKVTEILSNIF